MRNFHFDGREARQAFAQEQETQSHREEDENRKKKAGSHVQEEKRLTIGQVTGGFFPISD